MKVPAWVALSLACGCALMLSACVPTVRPTAPDVPTAPAGQPPSSTIGLTISIPIKPLLDSAEASLPSSQSAREYVEFFGTGGPDRPSCGIGCAYDVKRSALSFAVRANEITTNYSLSYWLSCRKRIRCKGRLVTGSCGKDEPRRRISESLTTRITVLPNWSTDASTTDNGAVAEDPCAMGRLGVVDVTDKLAARFGDLGKNLDGWLERGLSALRPKAESVWRLLSDPIQVDVDTWLEVRPEKVSMSGYQISADALQLAADLTAQPVVEVGAQPAAVVSSLPNATPSTGRSGGGFEVYMPVKADYSAVAAALRQRLKLGAGGLRYPPSGNHYLTPTDVTFYGYGQKAVFKIAFKGIAEGFVYLEGTPHFDADTNFLSFPDLDYSPESKKLALDSIQWVDHDAFIKNLRVRLVIDLADPLSQAKSKLSYVLNRQYGDVQLEGVLSDLVLTSVYASPGQQRFVAQFATRGSVKASVR